MPLIHSRCDSYLAVKYLWADTVDCAIGCWLTVKNNEEKVTFDEVV